MKVGILGLGRMARGMGWTVQHLPEAEPWACASRSLEKAVAFQREYAFRHAYDSYEKLYNDPDVELVYIATPTTSTTRRRRPLSSTASTFSARSLSPFTIGRRRSW